jgi:hypothetical protein
MSTPQERAEERRKEKLNALKEQVDEGSLVIRKMTAKERKKWGVKPPGSQAGGTGSAQARRQAKGRRTSPARQAARKRG